MSEETGEYNEPNYRTGNRQPATTSNVLRFLGEMLTPQTTGYKHVNLDMSFGNTPKLDRPEIENMSFIIAWCDAHNLPQNSFIEQNKLATRLNINRSLGGKSMDIINSQTQVSKQEFKDSTEKKAGFPNILGKKQDQERGQ